MHTPSDYQLHIASTPNQAIVEQVFGLVWRFDFTAPGFAVLDIGPGLDDRQDQPEGVPEMTARIWRG